MDVAVFVVAGAIILGGALGVVLSPNPVHSALMLVMIFGIAMLTMDVSRANRKAPTMMVQVTHHL